MPNLGKKGGFVSDSREWAFFMILIFSEVGISGDRLWIINNRPYQDINCQRNA